MEKEMYNVVGVMSGTSLDGIDLCYVEFKYSEFWSFKILNAKTVPYSAQWKIKLNDAINLDETSVEEINVSYTKYLGGVINDYVNTEGIIELDAICSHGHTVFHRPDEQFTLQIGNLPNLATIANVMTICDFRTQDVKLGGQGAPLVPIGDKLLFHDYDFCVNLGGFANVSFDVDDNRIAYDICPVNIVLNYYVGRLGKDYDENGNIANTGQINEALLNELNSHVFYKTSYPKSLGLEWVKSEIIPLIDGYNLLVKDILCTFVEHVAMQISKEINRNDHVKALFTGGGVYNSYLMVRISFYSNIKIIVPPEAIIEYKEAMIFGFLGVLKLRNEVNCLKSVTGAVKNHSSGVVFMP